MYGLLVAAALLFAMQFLFNQQFRKYNGDGVDSTVTFSMYTNGISFLILLILSGFKLTVTWFSALIAVIYAVALLLYSYSGLKAFATANLSLFSIFTMLGGLLMPFAYGVIFCNEKPSVAQICCVVLIIAATLLTFEKSERKGKNLKYYLAVFLLNGTVSVLAKMHQYNTELSVDSYSFMATVNIFVFVMCLAFQLIKNKKITIVSFKELGSVSGYAVCSGIGNLFSLLALAKLPASVQFPIITGGVMCFSTIISFIRKEKPTPRTVISVVLASVSTVLMMF
ncbi:MAG: hypothetical protein IKV76_07675 [Clostridia bacterium]|nr:hypothetical protein [Clostridia bacterium]